MHSLIAQSDVQNMAQNNWDVRAEVYDSPKSSNRIAVRIYGKNPVDSSEQVGFLTMAKKPEIREFSSLDAVGKLCDRLGIINLILHKGKSTA